MKRPDDTARKYEGYDAYDEWNRDLPPGWWILGGVIGGAAVWTVIGVVVYRVLT